MPRWLKPALRPVAWGLILGISAAARGASGEIRSSAADGAGASRPAKEAVTDVVRERYSNGAPRIERHVAQDAEGNFFNHGPWKMWDAQGRVMAVGQYRDDQRDGPWVRFFKAGEAEMIAGPIGRQFEAPFASEATFEGGQLHGRWVITDARQREVISWQYAHGKRDGKSVWWFPNGLKWREMNYREGEIVGEFTEWTPDNQLVTIEQYVEGRRWGTQVEWYEPGKKKTETRVLFAREITQLDEDWWDGYSHPLLTAKQGRDVRQGPSVMYYRTGQKAMQVNYYNDQPTGQFVWWHPNGQRAIEGQYSSGKQAGTWAWWHANGQKWIEGDYQAGVQVGRWTWWNSTGKVVEAAMFVDQDIPSPDQGLEAVEAPPELTAPPAPHRASHSRRPAVGVAAARLAD
jgi:antitoxin component YwqK of YwqJK toxin-antitoxin module